MGKKQKCRARTRCLDAALLFFEVGPFSRAGFNPKPFDHNRQS